MPPSELRDFTSVRWPSLHRFVCVAASSSGVRRRQRLQPIEALPEDTPEPGLIERDAKRPLWTRVVSFAVWKWLKVNTVSTAGMTVDAEAERNRHLFNGKIQTLRVKFDSISLASLSMSGGCVLKLRGVHFQYLFLLTRAVRPLKKPAEVDADCVFLVEDISKSKLVKNLMNSLVNTILSRLLLFQFATPGASAIVESVGLDGRRVAVKGTVTSALSTVVLGFVVSFGLSLAAGGHNVVVDDVCAVLNPGDPFLETPLPSVSLGFIDIDIGENARIDKLDISSECISLTGWTRLSPAAPFQVSYPEKRAFYTFDIGAMLSTLASVSS